MRCLGANFLSSTCAPRTASSSSSGKAKSGTCFNSSGLHGMDHLLAVLCAETNFEKTIADGQHVLKMTIRLHVPQASRQRPISFSSVHLSSMYAFLFRSFCRRRGCVAMFYF